MVRHTQAPGYSRTKHPRGIRTSPSLISYDNAGQLTGASGSRTETYSYDSGGNRATSGYTTAAANRVTASPGFTYTYDDEGNRGTKTDTSTHVVTSYSYDYRERLTTVTISIYTTF